MNDKHHTLVLGVLAAVAIGCAGPSSLKRAGSPKSGNKSGMVTATASKYTFLHMEWGNDSIGSLAHKNGIRYVLSANHHGVGLPLLGKKKITIQGLPSEAAFLEWKANKRQRVAELTPELLTPKLDSMATALASEKRKADKRKRAEVEAMAKVVALLERRKMAEDLAMAKVMAMLEQSKVAVYKPITQETHSIALSQ